MDTKIRALLTKLEPISQRYLELVECLESPEIIADNRLYLRLSDEKNSLEEAYTLGESLKVAIEIDDEGEIEALYALLSEELRPKDERDLRSALLEIRSENPQADAFRAELQKVYFALAKRCEYKVSLSENEAKFVTLLIEGKGAYSYLKRETGVNRSTGGKVGNANVWVSVLPKMDDVSIVIRESDLRTDIFHSSGAGGQNINKVATAVRLTHLPTGIVVVAKEERSQLQNRNRARDVLYARLYAHYHELENRRARKESSGVYQRARNNRVRLYDYDHESVTELRTNQTITLKQAYDGELSKLITPLHLKESKG
ncbi:MAG: PCRF domain-containing protein [Clostridia bacterium]|nr:PCRF domain-containing protein [Clostridia bacterium]